MPQSCLPSRSMGPHPRRCWVTPEVLSPLFPAWVQSWEMPSTTVGLAGSGAHQSYYNLGDEACNLLPGSVTEQKFNLSFSCPLRGHSGVPRTQGGTYKASAAERRDLLLSKVRNPLWFLHPSCICALATQNEPRSGLCSTSSLCWCSEQLSSFSGMEHGHISLSTVSARAQPIGRERYGTRRLCSWWKQSVSFLRFRYSCGQWIKHHLFFPKLIFYLFNNKPFCSECCTSVNNVHGTVFFVPESKQMDLHFNSN